MLERHRQVAAKHAISIDENRADFKRVGWSPTAEKQGNARHGNLYFEQVWFPGVLNWLLAGASLIPGGLKHDGSVLRLSPDPAGLQHNEQAFPQGRSSRASLIRRLRSRDHPCTNRPIGASRQDRFSSMTASPTT
ncbi:phospholipase effector Tle1 domain-containing protein [Bradyrhizobium yuanmingense]|uniref:phospholipase effector Tle1 domain-containing protein n=1 Tax=Bradyrhizobium TaxID=374 RepID=UPI003B9701A1